MDIVKPFIAGRRFVSTVATGTVAPVGPVGKVIDGIGGRIGPIVLGFKKPLVSDNLLPLYIYKMKNQING